MRASLLVASASLLIVVGCGKHEEGGPDLRTTPPMPESASAKPKRAARPPSEPSPSPTSEPTATRAKPPAPAPDASPSSPPAPPAPDTAPSTPPAPPDADATAPAPAAPPETPAADAEPAAPSEEPESDKVPNGITASPSPEPPAKPGAPAAPGVPVEAAKPIKRTVPVTVDYTGQTVGSETVDVRARVEGFLESIHFTEGTFVKKGDRLYEIDKDRMQQIVEQAEGELNVAKANEEKAIADVNRNKPLVEKNAISREEYETSVSAAKAAHAKVEAAAAAVQRAKINMGYASVKSPIDGLVGKTEVDLGNLVGRGDATLLTTISKIDPIYAEVRISEVDVFKYRKDREARGGKPSELALFLSDGSKHPHPGQIVVVDRNVDTKTGTLLVQVSFPNPDNSIRPGQFARVQAVREVAKDALLVPQGAVEELQGTYRLYVVGEGNIVKGQSVTVGGRVGPLWMIKEGLDADDLVVVEGRQKIRDGARVTPRIRVIGDDGKLVPVQSAPGGAPADGKR